MRVSSEATTAMSGDGGRRSDYDNSLNIQFFSKETRHLALLGFLPPSTKSLVLYSSPSVVPISDHRAPSLVLCFSPCAVATALLLPMSRVRWWVISPCLLEVEATFLLLSGLTLALCFSSAADWSSATSLYEQAANRFRVAKDYERSKAAYEKASKGQEMLAPLGMQLSTWNQLLIWQRNSETGEKFALEETMPEEAIQLYTDVITILEEDGGGQMAFDLYRSATAVYINLRSKYLDAAPLQLKFGLAASKCNATNSQCKAYLSAIIIYLYTNDYKQEEMCYNDCSQIDAFCKSDQNRCASNLLAAYSDGDIEEIKRIAQSSSISNLDHSMIRLARKLPTGDVSALKGNTARQEDQPLDENDLT
ncbi:Gamma-soluble NSF attachment protein [Arachis hypogaea]|nr:Gamma-soluble NSF attachment protein [Arachis hypogaea]